MMIVILILGISCFDHLYIEHTVLNTLVLFVLRTSVSVHLMEWSPDGEYFATAGKVREQAKNKAL
jgi:hypothetical protein